MADLGEEVRLGPQFGAVDRCCGVQIAVIRLDSALSFEQGKTEDQPRAGGDAEDHPGQPVGVELVEAQQDREDEQESRIEQQHARDQQARRLITAAPVIERHCGYADRGQQHQQVDQPAVPQLLRQQDDRRQCGHQIELRSQQPGDPGFRVMAEEAQGQGEQREAGHQRGEIRDQRLAIDEPGRPDRQQAEVRHHAGQ